MRNLITIFFILNSLLLFAQQSPQYSHFVFNKFLINPAFAGIKKCADIKTGYRLQWIGFKGAPRTAFFSVNSLIRRENRYAQDKHALGTYVVADETHITSRTYFGAAYAYHKRLYADIMASAGIFAGAVQYKADINPNRLFIPNDPIISGARSSYLYPDIMIGFLIYNMKYWGGFSVKHLYPEKITPLSENSRFRQHIYFMAGYRKSKNGKYPVFSPSALLKIVPLSAPSLDLNLMYKLGNFFGFAFSYRVGEAAMILLEFNIKKIKLGYSFGFPLNKIRTLMASSHEIILGMQGCPTDEGITRDPCPGVYQTIY